MNIHPLQFVKQLQRFCIHATVFLLVGLNLPTAYAQICGPVANLIADRWTMVALPCVPTTATVQGVFGDDLNPGRLRFSLGGLRTRRSN